MGERLGLRLRFALFFAALAAGGVAAVVAGLWIAHGRYGGPAEGYVVAGLVAGFAILALTTWIGLLFDQNVANPIRRLASDLHTRAQAEVGAGIDETPARYLGALAPAANEINAALAEARAAQDRAIARETERLNREKALFEALLRDLAEGVVVATPDNRIMLYNRVAQELLGDIGLDRRLEGFLRPEPLLHAVNRMEARRARGQAESESFLVATAEGERFLLGRVSPVVADGAHVGHVVIFHDATDDLKSHAERDHLFNELLEHVRRPAAGIGAILDVLQADSELPAETRATFDAAMRDEITRLFSTLRDMSRRHGEATTRHWPLTEVAAEDIFDALKARCRAPLTVRGGQSFLRCDGFAIMELLARVLDGLTESDARHDITLKAERHDTEVWLTVEWQGPEVTEGMIDGWMRTPLSQSYGDYSGRDALDGHRTEIWCETAGDGDRIVLPLQAAGAPALSPEDSRPEFYDFDLPQAEVSGDLAERPLKDLSYVVFDTETTGLAPRGGDEIVQIAGLRIVNGRILHGEAFDQLVDPGRPIPPGATAVHGIDDAQVRDAPKMDEVGRAFHDFCGGSILVAHNAPFDMTFLRLKEAQIGRRFDQPALCTVLLSAALFEHTGEHTLDALAARFGVSIPPELRHTAMGDTVATAEIFLQMQELMRARGIETLGDAVGAAERMTRIRKAQNY